MQVSVFASDSEVQIEDQQQMIWEVWTHLMVEQEVRDVFQP